MKATGINWPLMMGALLPWASLAAAALFTPRLTRPDIFFAVTVKPSFRQSPNGQKILRRYDRSVVCIAILSFFLTALIQVGKPLLIFAGLLGPVLTELAGMAGAFVAARRRVLPYHAEPIALREVVLQPRQVSLPGGWLAQTGPFLILAAACLTLWLHWESIPSRIPIHWGLEGRPDGWAAKSPLAVFGCAAVGWLICAMLASLWYAIARGVRRIYNSGAAAARESRFLRAMSLFMLGMEYWLACLMSLLSLAALRRDPAAPLPAFGPVLLGQTIILTAIFVIAYRSGQGGWRLARPGEVPALGEEAAPVGDRTPDERWKLGLFYFNPDDPALFVEKRFGIGWTLNLANPRAWLVVGGILFFALAAAAVSLLMTR